uniref:Uncharacterized protein n=1 Tax=Chaetoceros debilis TaxID=122233 RepID=A0A7S3VE40_9STRA|mmetsp:Transcript_13569/g.20194  ORF Transcript_13569/g.20194 Transcript_13569/m.20194 type:complete len:586 (+) Transcript_13569:124-1881(+)|eukprot:CAMPEP_0194084026 /NCGR_PEP_ID=MMETSP0149-20130528/10961_1 /TAXON_ID=122233 /ORGANISM="Chaetoceros debilis, Strain MM31A-1" /LENGTH=585 /DNA_ID=CAMNT_0038766553 /DNA_START=98 /DNA_END=1855 /DNA_ORIENTATION=+
MKLKEEDVDASLTSPSSESSGDVSSCPTVAVIGCGPAGMFFLHAMAARRKQFEEANDTKSLKKMPNVTCYEMSSSPGGVWRTADPSNEGGKARNTNMYQALWTNANSGNIEFFDYTFLDHFGKPMPLFLPRKHVLEYMIARATQHEDIFQHVKFNTTVKSVTYDKDMKKFVVVNVDANEEETTDYFDKCLWASGINGKPNFVKSVNNKLKEGKYEGTVIHSSQMDKIGADVKGKRILMIGDNYSAEDLALQCIKLGAERIFVTSRQCFGIVNGHVSWPEDRVEILRYSTVDGVKKGSGTTILTKGSHAGRKKGLGKHEIEDVAIIIFCTGYKPNIDILDRSLKPFLEGDDYDDWDSDEDEYGWEVDADWRMKPNLLTPYLGHVEPSDELEPNSDFVQESMYKRVNIENTNMLYLFENSIYPLLDIDIASHYCVRLVLNEIKLPTKEEMHEENRLQLLNAMDAPSQRFEIDSEYRKAVIERIDWDEFELEHELTLSWQTYGVECLAMSTDDANYPLPFRGENGEFTEAGKKMMQHCLLDVQSRWDIPKEDASWRTFRDTDTTKYTSMITGTKPISLKGRWIDIDED